jgi:hypothetical protein
MLEWLREQITATDSLEMDTVAGGANASYWCGKATAYRDVLARMSGEAAQAQRSATIGQTLVAALGARGWTLGEFAWRAGVSSHVVALLRNSDAPFDVGGTFAMVDAVCARDAAMTPAHVARALDFLVAIQPMGGAS